MKVLVACEESQAVCIAFRGRGHEAYSCDLIECSGGHPEWHIKGDALKLIDYPWLRGFKVFKTMDGVQHVLTENWDLIIAHPPCTYLSVAGNRYLNVERYGQKAIDRAKNRELAAEFFLKFINADCERIAVENPVGYMNAHFRKPDQITYPWNFGTSNNKPICLWLKGLPPLKPTEIVPRGEVHRFPNGKTNSVWWAGKSAKERSKTFQGIARAMAEQWSAYIESEGNNDR